MRRLSIVCAAVGITCATVTACDTSTAPLDPDIRLMEELPPEYWFWWVELGECLKFPPGQADFHTVKFYSVGNTDAFACVQYHTGKCRGLWIKHREIYLAAGRVYHKETVTHEMTHIYLHQGDHSNPAWERCNLV